MPGEVDQAVAPFSFRFFQVFKTLHFNELLELFSRTECHLAEEAQFAAETVETITQKPGALLFALFRKCEVKIRRSGSPEVTREVVSNTSQRPPKQHGRTRR